MNDTEDNQAGSLEAELDSPDHHSLDQGSLDQGSLEPGSPDQGQHESQLLDMLLGFGTLGALSGGLVTLLTLMPGRALTIGAPSALPAALALLTCCTSGVALSGLAYIGRRTATGRLDERVGRALPIAFLFLAPMIAPWTRLVIAFPRFIEAAFAVSFAVGAIALASIFQTFRAANRVSAVFAALDACEYGALALGLGLAGGPVALAGLAAAAIAVSYLLVLHRRGDVDPSLLGGARAVPRPAVAIVLALALSLSGFGIRAALAPEPLSSAMQLPVGSVRPHRGAPILLRGAIVTVSAETFDR